MHWGLEMEYLLLRQGQIADFTNTSFAHLQDLLDPVVPGVTDKQLVKGDLGIKRGYWYLEGDERFDSQGNFIDCNVKGVEIRTPISPSYQAACQQLDHLEAQLKTTLQPAGYELGLVGFNPVTKVYTFAPPLNDWERRMRREHREYDAAEISNLTYGPDVNLSFDDWSADKVYDTVRKLTYYSPFMVAFSFSSPFFAGKLWDGYSKRTFERTWRRAAARAFIKGHFPETVPPLVYAPRVTAEAGRIEFKAFDAILSRQLLRALCALVIGVCLDEQLAGRADRPDKTLHQSAARLAFSDPLIYAGTEQLLDSIRQAVKNIPGATADLDYLGRLLKAKRTPSHWLRDHYGQTGTMVLEGGLIDEL